MHAQASEYPHVDAAQPSMHERIRDAAQRSCARVSPLWPLERFVAVNPFHGLADKHFDEAARWLERVARVDMVMPLDHYVQCWDDGSITDRDVEAALATAAKIPGVSTVQSVREAIRAPAERPAVAVVATIAETLDRLAEGDRETSRTAFMVEHISKWCAGYFDVGQAAWRSPWRELKPYAAWRAAMAHDRDPEVMGVHGFRRVIEALPDDPVDTIAYVVERLGIPERAYDDYLFRAFFDIQGWAAYTRYRAWGHALEGREDDTPLHLLAIRVAWGYALFEDRDDEAFRGAWAAAMAAARAMPQDEQVVTADALALRLLMQEAYEHASQRRLLALLAPVGAADAPDRPDAQLAFCIDVRSEVFRRALEAQSAGIQTLGFAGFFGFPIEYVPIAAERGSAQCPVLLKPTVIVREGVKGASQQEGRRVLRLRRLHKRLSQAWKAFKLSAVSSFSFVETLGLGFVVKIVSDALGWTRPVPDPSHDGIDAKVIQRLAPVIEPGIADGRVSGFDRQTRVAMAEAVLRAMSLTDNFARLVVLAGHGSSTVNNPHAAGLQCGACGGHTGEANARVAAAILNDPAVREGLAERSIHLPQDTHFVGALHDTTTDEVTLFDTEQLPPGHQDDLAAVRRQLADAARQTRIERAGLLGVSHAPDLHRAILARSRDWSQVRPEWGLAGNLALIAAPRACTRGRTLEGRVFLHDYQWRRDRGFATLELIMTAPMVVANWINLQYFASSVNNDVFGSGNKTLHNVVGALGVLEGNGGDLRTGLPWQSVHDGKRLIHEPLRLSVFLNAPIDAIESVIAKHALVRQLVENKWLHLFAIDDAGGIERYWGQGTWTTAAMSGQAA